MTLETLKLTALTSAIVAIPAFAFAMNVGDSVGTTEAEIRAALEAAGAEVVEIEIEDGEIEVEYLVNGVEYEAEVDPATGTIAEVEADDEDDGEDDDEDSDNG